MLDEMFSPAIAIDLESRGISCRAVAADPVLRAHSDLEILEAALLENRVLVTNNVADFESLRRAWEAAGREVPGLIYTSDLAFPRTRAYLNRLAAALEVAAASRETGRRGGVLWLRPAGLTGFLIPSPSESLREQSSSPTIGCHAREPDEP